MPKFLFVASYSFDGLQDLLGEGGSARRADVEQLAERVGGTVESFYFAFGSDDAFVTAEVPDEEAAAAVALAIGASGKANVRTIPLVSPEQIDTAVQRVPTLQPPGA